MWLSFFSSFLLSFPKTKLTATILLTMMLLNNGKMKTDEDIMLGILDLRRTK
jgi:hypothetical protein